MKAEVLVIREADRFSEILVEQGFKVTNFALIKTAPLEDLSELEKSLEIIETYDGIFITSSSAAKIILTKSNELQKSFQGKFFVLGEKSRKLIESKGFDVFFSEQATTAEELLQLIPASEISGKRFLFPCGDKSLRTIPEKLKDAANVREVIVYKTVATEIDQKQSDKVKEKLEKSAFTAICFFSPSGIENFIEKFPKFAQKNIKIAAIGKTTANFAAQKQMTVQFIAAKPNAEDFARDLAGYLENGTSEMNDER